MKDMSDKLRDGRRAYGVENVNYTSKLQLRVQDALKDKGLKEDYCAYCQDNQSDHKDGAGKCRKCTCEKFLGTVDTLYGVHG